ncbi:MAG: RHS repeat-associated core domain-containing protein, partial [Ethanoligenens sp.]
TVDSYNALDVLAQETDADGTVTKLNQYGEPTASGDKTYTYDSNGNLLQTVYSDSTTDAYTYDADGNLTSEKNQNGKKTFCKYDTTGNMVKKAVQNDGTSIDYTDTCDQTLFAITTYAYNSNGSLKTETDSDGTVTTDTYDGSGDILTQVSVKRTITTTVTNTYNAIRWVTQSISSSQDTSNNSNTSTTTTYVYDKDGQTVRQINGIDVTRYVFDGAGRLIQKINPDEYIASKDGLNKSTPDYSYADSTVGYKYAYTGGSTIASSETMPNGEMLTFNDSGVVVSVHNPANGAAVSNISYTYDDNNNIQTISENGAQKVAYSYDSSNQLTRENNIWQSETITYTYDSNGNILTKTVYPYTAGDLTSVTAIHTYTYTYGNSSDANQPTSYDGKPITYDASGDVTNYNGWTYTWANGNLSGSSSAGNTISYQYNADGIRTSKTVNGKTTAYTLNGSEIKSQSDGTNTTAFTYDDQGSPLTMTLNGVKYTYEKNAQGDVTGLIDSNGNEVVTYQYDSWGKLLVIGGSLKDSVGLQNPLRYRGYYYDTETGLYYLQSRYYTPEWGRFISKDDNQYHEGGTGVAANLYAYANNNPVMNVDPDGHRSRIQYLFNAIAQIGSLVFEIFEFHEKWGAIYFASRYVARFTGAYAYDMIALQCDAAMLTPAAVSQNYGLVIALLAGIVALACMVYWIRLVVWDYVESAMSDMHHFIYGW